MFRPIIGMQDSEHSEYLQTTDIQPDSSLKSPTIWSQITSEKLKENSEQSVTGTRA